MTLSYPVDAQPLMSLPRYMVVLFPLQMWLARWAASAARLERAVGVSAVAARAARGAVRALGLRRVSAPRALLLDALGTLVELEPPVEPLRRELRERFGLEVERGGGGGARCAPRSPSTARTTTRRRDARGWRELRRRCGRGAARRAAAGGGAAAARGR